MDKLLKSQQFTENEIAFIMELGYTLRMNFGEHFTDVDCKDLAQGLKWTQSKVKGVLSSLMKKKVIETDHIVTDQAYELIYFNKQDEMIWLKTWSR